MEEQQTSAKPATKVANTKQAFLLGIGVFFVIIVVGGVFYVRSGVQQQSTNPTIVSFSKVLGLSIASVNGEKILYADYVEDMNTLEQFYASEASAPAVPRDQISDQVLARLVANTLIAQIAKDQDVSVSEEDITAATSELLAQFPDEATLESEIMARYGWTFDTYVERVIRPVILEQKLSEAYIAKNTDPSAARAQAEAILARATGGEEFAALAAEFGTDGTRLQGGDLGYFARGVMVPEFEEAAFTTEVGAVRSELVETQFGFHILKVEDKRTTRTPDGTEVEEVRARHILIQNGGTEDFISFMDEQFAAADIQILIEGINNPFEQIFNQAAVEEGTEQMPTEEEIMQMLEAAQAEAAASDAVVE
jgi:parvulin-like peptidyl-prolyl isomerase